MFHGECLRKWAMRNKPSGNLDCVIPVPSRNINLFKEGENVFTCPCCRAEYTHDVHSGEIDKVIAKVHINNKGERLVHYITHPMDTIVYVPVSEEIGDTEISGKWATILTLLKKGLENGQTDIYAVKRVSHEPEFVLTTSEFNLPPIEKESGMPKTIYDGMRMEFESVEVDELNTLLNT